MTNPSFSTTRLFYTTISRTIFFWRSLFLDFEVGLKYRIRSDLKQLHVVRFALDIFNDKPLYLFQIAGTLTHLSLGRLQRCYHNFIKASQGA